MSGRNTSFAYSFLALPAARRRAITAVWDFCRAVDDTVDEVVPAATGPAAAAEQARRGLEMWRAEVRRCYAGEAPATAQGRALQPYVSAYGLPRAAFEAVIDGVEMDLTRRRYDDIASLLEYCRRVASAVGLICIEIFGYRDPRTREYAEELGIALQLTNIVRDVAVDLSRGRIYLPLEDLARFGCTEADLAAGRVTGPVRDLLAFECARARACYARAEGMLPAVDRRRLVAARIMASIYRDILARVERAGYDVFSGVARASKPRRAALAATTWMRTMIGW